MGMFLNSRIPFESYRLVVRDDYFVDKSALIRELIPALGVEKRFFCITRPRRFGKSVMAGMVGAFFGKAADAAELFEPLAIARCEGYREHLNRHCVVYIDFSRMPQDCDTYSAYIGRISEGLKRDLAEEYPTVVFGARRDLWDMFQAVYEQSGQNFIFVMDEWDAVFHREFISEKDRKSYLEFLRNLLKGQTYVELAYMTGILPIAKYSGGSELNMFAEYDMATRARFGEYFGFLDSEVDALYERYLRKNAEPRITREELALWYNGYHTAAGDRMYNPRSVVCALSDNQISNYWTGSGPYDEIFYYIRNDIDDVSEDLALMVSGERIEVKLQGYAATGRELSTKNQIYSAMVVYGLLTYEDGAVFIPNRELMDKFNELLLTNDVDFIFYPERKSADALILELKIDSTPEDAIRQIRQKKYALRFDGKLGEKTRHTGRILAVGISYDRRTKEHFCKVEEL